MSRGPTGGPSPRAGLSPAAAGVAICAILILAGCGDGGEPAGSPAAAPAKPQTVTPRERRLIESYDRRIAIHCLRVSRSLVEPAAAPTPRQARAAFDAARSLLALAADKPSAPLGAGQDLRLFVSDVIENLEGSNCDPRMIALLEEGLGTIPPA